jgi:hypothetical protein
VAGKTRKRTKNAGVPLRRVVRHSHSSSSSSSSSSSDHTKRNLLD